MSGVDPDDPGQQGILIDGYECVSHSDDEWARKTLTALRDHIAAQPRMVELPAEDRALVWKDTRGATWTFYDDPHWEDGNLVAGYWEDEDYRYGWPDVLWRFGPLTCVGPAADVR